MSYEYAPAKCIHFRFTNSFILKSKYYHQIPEPPGGYQDSTTFPFASSAKAGIFSDISADVTKEMRPLHSKAVRARVYSWVRGRLPAVISN